MASTDRITIPELSRLTGTPDAPMIVDVSTDEDFAATPALIPTALRHPFREVEALAPRLAGKRAVIVCHRGLKLSMGAAALLRSLGVCAASLEGGNVGWREAGQPAIPVVALPPARPGGSLWVTRRRPKVDRIACPWLVRRFVDRDAKFLFVEASEVANVADRFAAIPFDIEGVRFTHRGDRCSFDAMIEDFRLGFPALARLAAVVRGADTDRHDLASQAAGLLAVSVGLSRQFEDDLEQLEAGMTLYDALYRWARDGFEEGHDWPAGRRA